MRPADIKVGVTYRNRGKGRTKRTVKDIGKHLDPPEWYGFYARPDEPVVLFEQEGQLERRLYLSSFAAWAGGVAGEET